MLTDTRRSPYAKMYPVDGTRWTDGLWKDVEDTVFKVTVPHLQAMFDAPDISHVVENFRIAAGEAEGDFDGTVFGDGDFYKWMEAELYSAVVQGTGYTDELALDLHWPESVSVRTDYQMILEHLDI